MYCKKISTSTSPIILARDPNIWATFPLPHLFGSNSSLPALKKTRTFPKQQQKKLPDADLLQSIKSNWRKR